MQEHVTIDQVLTEIKSMEIRLKRLKLLLSLSNTRADCHEVIAVDVNSYLNMGILDIKKLIKDYGSDAYKIAKDSGFKSCPVWNREKGRAVRVYKKQYNYKNTPI